MLLTIIIACEIGFWVFVVAGLIARYPLRRPRLGAILLAIAPIVDLVLLVATVLDLRAGAQPRFVHALAAIYIGVSIGFGHSMIRWADARFAHRFAGGPPPAPKPKRGHARAMIEAKGWLRHLLSWVIGCGLLFGAARLVGTPEAEALFHGVIRTWSIALGVDAIWSFSYLFDSEQTPRSTVAHDEREAALKR